MRWDDREWGKAQLADDDDGEESDIFFASIVQLRHTPAN